MKDYAFHWLTCILFFQAVCTETLLQRHGLLSISALISADADSFWAFFIKARQRQRESPGTLLVDAATWSKFGGVVYAKAITLCLGRLP